VLPIDTDLGFALEAISKNMALITSRPLHL